MTPNLPQPLTVTCPTCGHDGLHVEHRRTVSFELDFSGPLGPRGHVCPRLHLVDEGEIDAHGEIVWSAVGRVLESGGAEGELDDDDDGPTSAGHTVRAHSAELLDSRVVVTCSCGWSRSDDAMPPELTSLFNHLRAAASTRRGTVPFAAS